MVAAQLLTFFDDQVLAVVAQAEVGLDDGADEVAEGIGGLADAQHVVVQGALTQVDQRL
jgi:hypothetical protein